MSNRPDRVKYCRLAAFATALLLWVVGAYGLPTPRVLETLYTPCQPLCGWKIEVADYDHPQQGQEWFELYSTPLSPPGPRKRISHTIPPGSQGWDVNTGVRLLRDASGWRVAYVMTHIVDGASDLYTVSLDGTAECLVDHLVQPGMWVFGGTRLIYSAQTVAGGQAKSWSIDSRGQDRHEVLFVDGFESGGKERWR